ncbi:MAG: TetR/AcrR family transcriptional regulator [Acidobacteria bacterium]|nr:TetR/AcrR family transcriptional regulator [Acidobacteriota bacterium]
MAELNARERLLHAAEQLTYRHGFAKAALVDIAKAAKVPPGNVYYYFKTKNEIGNAVIELRLSRFRKLLEELNKAGSPKECLCAFIDIKVKNREALARRGCPVGTLCSELHKDAGPVAKKSTTLLSEALTWMEAKFAALGKPDESRSLAIHLLSATQGASLLAHTFHDPMLIEIEAAQLKKWIRSL